jgi:cytochrome c-type biogenesis protein CcmF
MTEASIDAGFFRDIYVALGDKVDDNAWAVRIHYKPLVRWIWLGAIFMACGGLLAIMDKRYKIKKRLQETNGKEDVTDTALEKLPS